MNRQPSDSLIPRYQKLTDITQDLASTLDLDILLSRIVQAAAELSNAKAASILLYDRESQKLHFQVATNLEKPLLRGIEVPVEDSLAGWIVKNQKAIIIDDVAEDERHFDEISEITGKTISSLLGVPLITKGNIIGVLEAVNKKRGGFTPEDQEILSVLGAQAAVAIQNSRLFKQSDLITEFVHELRTPLSSLLTATQLLTHPKTTAEKKTQVARQIHAEVERLDDLATSFLDVARLESGRDQLQVGEYDLGALLRDCMGLIRDKAHQAKVTCEVTIPPELPTMIGDGAKIKRAMLNLLNNAVKYNQTGSSSTHAGRARL